MLIQFTPVLFHNCRQVHGGPLSTQNFSTHPQTPRHRCTHTPKHAYHTKTIPANASIVCCPKCIHLKMPITCSHLHTHTPLNWGFHTDTNPYTDPQTLLQGQPWTPTCVDIHLFTLTYTHLRTSSCLCHVYLCNRHACWLRW